MKTIFTARQKACILFQIKFYDKNLPNYFIHKINSPIDSVQCAWQSYVRSNNFQ